MPACLTSFEIEEVRPKFRYIGFYGFRDLFEELHEELESVQVQMFLKILI
jgi:hypothetical protein